MQWKKGEMQLFSSCDGFSGPFLLSQLGAPEPHRSARVLEGRLLYEYHADTGADDDSGLS